ncbi:polA protein [Agrilactobacillus composti DSM 18527 = JCM 14202]|uniref:DNA polymerase I n=1 Tax=Agrilactobacillus composti DSM 18527 = JCM 14202 TaxID=1423734 RepID=X0PPP1_9LACO|nr:DNA polymerase I [Agrilactobacillus composti]KRM35774.1 polA protein [Agrilactobacillus composti DSM 18527 = JCM 14202]GAF39637.1 DNA polymerase I [Agrilactobacillus composti DSM 18527 = JCM 14202]
MNKQDKLLLIDGNSLMFRAFFALHNALDHFTNHDGLHTNAIYAFKTMLDDVLKQVEPTHILVAFDAGKTTFRTAKFEDYKGGRAKMPSELAEQLPYMRQFLDAYGIKWYELKDFEADDIIGTVAKDAEAAGFKVTIITGDRDLTQLTTANTTVEVTVKGVKQLETYTPEHVQEKLGIDPKQIVEMKGLMGDTSDNYPGVTKIGEVTALKLVKKYGSIAALYDNIDSMKKSKMKENLINDQAAAFMSRDLAQIRQDAPVTVQINDLVYTGPNLDALIDFYKEMDFKSFLSALDADTDAATAAESDVLTYETLTSANLKDIEALQGPQAFLVEMLADNYHSATLDGFAIGNGNKWYVSNDVNLLSDPILKNWLMAKDQEKYVFDLKRTYVALNRLGIQIQNVTFDLLLASYLLDTNENSNDLGEIAQLHGYTAVQTDEVVYGKGAKRAIPSDQSIYYDHLAKKVRAIFELRDKLMAELDKHEQTDLFKHLEMPLALVLANMEIAGITVDATRLVKMQGEFKSQLEIIAGDIYDIAGTKFNLNSPKQLSEILFEKLQLPVIKKTKTGYSTAVDVLEKLRTASPIIDNILKYRQISKIQSTYVNGLLKQIYPDHKVHTRYLQTLTQTGRLSSVDPNLQNIPVRIEEGRKIRQAFVPRHPDWEIFSSDYSQVELRVLAHISGDENMREAFRENRDIHANTAMKIFNLKDASEVTPDMRRQAKATNFGIVYGISDYGLSQNIGITRKEAKRFIDAYFEQYPKVKLWTEDIVKSAREKGYVETLMHRRRYLPDIHSKNFNLRSFAERTAMNTPIQGSAADIIKVAMINMAAKLKEANLQAVMLLQVHDELIFEAPQSEIPVLEKLVPSVMDSAVKLAVPLKVDSGYGKTWYDVKK